MKKFLILLGLVISLSCTPLKRCEYLCTITYSIDGVSHTEEVKLVTGTVCTPAYVHSSDMLRITGVPSSDYYYQGHIIYKGSLLIYKGSLPILVEHFEYKLLREFKVNLFSGKELK